jgi:putative hydrolase of the HAD superfamily
MNVVFDFGGVLFEWQPHEFLKRLLPQHTPDDLATRDLVQRFFQSYGGDWAEFDRGTVSEADLALRISARTSLPITDVERVIAGVPQELLPMVGTLALMQRLRARGHRLFYLSNMPASYARHLEATHDFVAQFEAGVFSSRVQLIKPEPEIYDHALSVFGTAAADTLFIDDMLVNVQAAQTLGWQGIHFQNAVQCEAALAELGLISLGPDSVNRP